MTVPSFEECMQPILELASDESTHKNREAIEYVSGHFKLTNVERTKLIPSGIRTLIDDRVLWTLLYLRKAEFIQYVSRGVFEITGDGKKLLRKRRENAVPPLTTRVLLSESKKFQTWYRKKAAPKKEKAPSSDSGAGRSVTKMKSADKDTPWQRLEEAYDELTQNVLSELIDKLHELDDRRFEIFIANLLPRIGYGKDANDIIRAHGGKGDGGIDGIVQLDVLGAERIYIQAKHWKSPVDLKPVVKFWENIQKKSVRAGLFVALSGFDKNATEFINEHPDRIAWIDAEKMAEVMISKGVGVIQDTILPIYRVDDEYFDSDSN